MSQQQQATMDKIVNVNEFSDQLQTQLKIGLSFGQLMSLKTAGEAIKAAIKSAYQFEYSPEDSTELATASIKSSLKSLFKGANSDDTLGLYITQTQGEHYISGASIQVMAQIMLDHSQSSGDNAEKILNAVSQAFCASENQLSNKARFSPVF
mgnify:CR=1 FL=1|tara:strand:+ start:640506 stop:640961 length:456 start_codon:yes stop_codon:yes gene_type:complete